MNRLFLLLVLAIANPAFASCWLKADTTNNNFAIGPFVDPTTGDAETGLTVADGDILWKQPDSTTFAEETGFSDCTHRAAGMYTCPYDNTVVDTEGMAEYVVDVAGALTVFGKCMVVGSAFFDILDGTVEPLTKECAGASICSELDGAPTSQTVFDITAADAPTNDDGLIGAGVLIVGGTERGYATVCDYDQANDRFTVTSNGDCATPTALDFTIADEDLVYFYPGGNGRDTYQLDADLTTHDAALAVVDGNVDDIETAVGDAGANLNAIPGVHVGTGNCDSGTTSTCVDATLTEADDYWSKGVMIVFQGGTIGGQNACVYDFTASSDTISFRPSLTAAVDTDAYVLIAAPGCAGVVAP